MVNSVLIDPRDMVVTVTRAIAAGGSVRYSADGGIRELVAVQDIPIYHKVAVAGAKKGQAVIKYGERIGAALQDFGPGEHVHTHNLGSVGVQE